MKNFVVIGHSHGASIEVLDHIFAKTKVKPRGIYIMPCFDPRIPVKERFDILFIQGEKDEDECSNKFETNNAVVIPDLGHYSFLDQGFLYANAGYAESGIDFSSLFPITNSNHTLAVVREINKFLDKF